MTERPVFAMKWTATILLSAFVAAAVYDGVVVCVYGVDASISRFMQNAGNDSPFTVFVCGYLAGHFWGVGRPNQTATQKDDLQSTLFDLSTIVTAMLVTIVLYDAINVFRYGSRYSLSQLLHPVRFYSPFVTLIAGYLVGHVVGFLKPSNFRCHGKNND